MMGSLHSASDCLLLYLFFVKSSVGGVDKTVCTKDMNYEVIYLAHSFLFKIRIMVSVKTINTIDDAELETCSPISPFVHDARKRFLYVIYALKYNMMKNIDVEKQVAPLRSIQAHALLEWTPLSCI